MFLLLLINPFYLFEVGFQLSYLAVFAIVWIQPKIYRLWQPKLWIADKFWQLFTVSMAAQIGVLPLSLYYFHQFPGLFFISNLVIIPFLGIILISGVLIMLLAVLDLLPQILSDGYIFVIHQMNNFISWISNQQVFIIQNITFSFAMLLAFYVVIFIMLKWTEKKNFQRLVLVLVSIMVLQSVFIFEKQRLNAAHDFIVFNKSRESVIGKRLGNKLLIDSSISDISKNEYLIRNYLVGTGLDSISISTEIQNLQHFKNETILLIDSLGLYKLSSIKPTIVVLRQSPKINLDRLLNSIQPRLIIADGSNYKSYVSKWTESCIKNKTPFYSTMQNGAFILN
jgi:competence protein ComEC